MFAKLCSAENMPLRDTDTSLSILLRTYSWLPATKVEYEMDGEDYVRKNVSVTMMPPSCIYLPLPDIESLMAHTVMYLQSDVNQQSSFRHFLKLKSSASIDEVKSNLIRWGERREPNKAAVFFTSLEHIKRVYKYLQQNLAPKPTQDLVKDNPIIFVPLKFSPQQPIQNRVVAGKFLLRTEVWWNEQTGLFTKYKTSLQEYHMDLAKKEIINVLYLDTQEVYDFLVRGGRIAMNPDVVEYGEFLVFLSSILSLADKTVLPDLLLLYETIGSYLQSVPDTDREASTRQMVLETNKNKLLSCLKGHKVFATKALKWASMEDKPLIADNRELEKFFKVKPVHFLDLEEKVQAKGRNYRRHGMYEGYSI